MVHQSLVIGKCWSEDVIAHGEMEMILKDDEYMKRNMLTVYYKHDAKYLNQTFYRFMGEQEFENTESIFTKRYLFLDMYPSIIEFLNRLLVDGDKTPEFRYSLYGVNFSVFVDSVI